MGSQSPARPQGLWTVLRVLLTQVSAELDRSWILVQISRKIPETTKDGERFQTAAEKAKEAHHFRRNQRTMTAAPRYRCIAADIKFVTPHLPGLACPRLRPQAELGRFSTSGRQL